MLGVACYRHQEGGVGWWWVRVHGVCTDPCGIGSLSLVTDIRRVGWGGGVWGICSVSLVTDIRRVGWCVRGQGVCTDPWGIGSVSLVTDIKVGG